MGPMGLWREHVLNACFLQVSTFAVSLLLYRYHLHGARQLQVLLQVEAYQQQALHPLAAFVTSLR